MDAVDAIRAIKADGGLAVIAHPGQFDFYAVIEELIPFGLDGLEVYHPDQQPEDIERTLALCQRYHLFASGGSDYHGRYWRPISLGQCLAPDTCRYPLNF